LLYAIPDGKPHALFLKLPQVEPQRRFAVERYWETVARRHQTAGERIGAAAVPGCAYQALMICCRSVEN